MRRSPAAILVFAALVLGLAIVGVADPIALPGAPRQTSPQIISVMPGSASPGDTIVIKAVNVPLDKNAVEVWFTIAQNKTAQGTIGRSAESRGQITYSVKVPGDDTLTAPFRGPLYIKIKETGRQTPAVQFRTLPIMPKITSHSPQYGKPGQTTTFRGVNFKADDEMSLANYGAVAMHCISATQITMTLPGNYPTAERLIRVTVRRKGSSTTQVAPSYTYALDPAVYSGESRDDGNTGQKVEPKPEEGGSKG